MVVLGSLRERVTRGAFEKNPMSYVCIPAVSRELHPKLLDKIGRAAAMADESAWNRVEGDGRWGIVCNGVSYGYVSDAIRELGAGSRFKILRVGFSHPFPEILTQRFLDACEKVLVVEEGEPYLQEAVRNCAHRFGMMLPVHGKGEKAFFRDFTNSTR
jgi:indolepyruvate ferredoxin oxidoreductase, alpha subunit